MKIYFHRYLQLLIIFIMIISIHGSSFGQPREDKESSRKNRNTSRVKKKNDDESTKDKRGQNEDIIERFSFADIKHFNPSGRIKAGQLTEEETKILQSTRKSLAEKYTRKNQKVVKDVQNLRKSYTSVHIFEQI